MTFTSSFMEKFLSQQRPWWVYLVFSFLMLALPIGIITLDKSWSQVVESGFWRYLYLSPVLIVYILVLAPTMARNDKKAIDAFRPLVLLDQNVFDDLVHKSYHTNRIGEAIAVFLGVLFGLFMSWSWFGESAWSWLRIYTTFFLSLMFALLGWVIFNSQTTFRITHELHRQPLYFNIFDVRLFEPVGRQSLAFALVFVGGITLSIIFGLNVSHLEDWRTWLFYVPMSFVPVFVFFLNMRDTHRLLTAEKKRSLEAVGTEIQAASQKIHNNIDRTENIGELAAEYTALVAYEARLRAIPTWPFNVFMLRTLVFSILIPLIVRGISAFLFGQ
jgi:hypothetical protein